MATSELMAPIPGMSLTTEPGNRPWEQPARFTKLEEVVDFYSDKMTQVETMNSIAEALEQDMPVVSLANVILKNGVLGGIHSVDTAYLATPIVVELIKSVAAIYGVGFVESNEDAVKMTSFPEKMAKQVIAEANTKMKEVVATEEKSSGLMSRGKK
tara:strand:+ start:368 stop:835 length:468 start_codon:yes stop_codon:yes gene_type:complete